MILVFPQATKTFNELFTEMIKNSEAINFLDKSFSSYEMKEISKVVLIVLENKLVEEHLNEYLSNLTAIDDFEILVLRKETSGSICTTLMAMPLLKNQTVMISALDQIIIGEKVDITSLFKRDIYDVVIPTYKSDNPSLCYVLKDDSDNVIQLFEKKPVSSDAVLGIYIIKNFTDFSNSCNELLIKYKGFKDRIFYTSDVINNFISQDFKIDFPIIESDYFKIRAIEDLDKVL